MLSGWDWFLAKQLQCKTYWRRFHAAVQVYKVLHKLSPSYLNGTFHYAVDITYVLDRTFTVCLLIPRVQTTLAKHSFYIQGTQIWNSLNPVLYTARKLEKFKSLYQSLYWIFMHACMYCISMLYVCMYVCICMYACLCTYVWCMYVCNVV